MSEQISPYISRKPGDLITAQDWNSMQEMIKSDISDQIQEAVDGIKVVPRAEDSDKLGGSTPQDLAQQVLEYVLRQLPKRTGYMAAYRILQTEKESVINHNLSAYPLVDVYELEYFHIVASEDGNLFEADATFYLYHSSESRIRFRQDNGSQVSVEIDPPGHAYRVPFQHMLELYGVQYDEDSPLGDVETEFWKAFNAEPNDRFDDDQYFHSPWFDRCCREERTVGGMRKDWNDIWFQARPRKSINYTRDQDRNVPPHPVQVGVMQFDMNSLGLTLLAPVTPPRRGNNNHLKVLVLLKV